ncbi:uncharacterized protein MEPE_03997 [Melanopsichium pennsylvanicum]|uniref:Uncharacterized protein n=1 Tax=Melanopsichium pennsylvanicum TaxID=63383 RepID=A0AAJ5C676_9BASI|nr:uncharacterized protein MEPE_03997 [Melanopsichium pennsylvanicum]
MSGGGRDSKVQELLTTSCANCGNYLPPRRNNVRLPTAVFCLQRGQAQLDGSVSGRVPEIRIPVRKRDSPDFSEFRRLSLASTDIEENPASGDLSTDIG